MPLTLRWQSVLVVILFAIAIAFYFTFLGITPYYFSGQPPDHTVDVHLKHELFEGFFDWQYLNKVQPLYDAEKYLSSYYRLDLAFLLLYTLLFFVLSIRFWNKKWMAWLSAMFVVGMIADLAENTTLYYFLTTPEDRLAKISMLCTSIKSVLFVVNLVLSCSLYIRGLFRRDTQRAYYGSKA